jgi:hypothetical protein
MGGACSIHGEMGNAYKILVGKPEGKRPLADMDACGKTILSRSYRNRVKRCGLGSSGLGYERVAGSCDPLKGGDLLDKLSHY